VLMEPFPGGAAVFLTDCEFALLKNRFHSFW
jgi:site-specific DNA-adenine methylase